MIMYTMLLASLAKAGLVPWLIASRTWFAYGIGDNDSSYSMRAAMQCE